MADIRYSDDDLRVIVQDWSLADPDQSTAIHLASELLDARGKLAWRDAFREDVRETRRLLDPRTERLTAACAARDALGTIAALKARVAALEAAIETLKEIGPVLSDCRWFLMDMHILPPEATAVASADLLPRVDAVIVKAHAALGHSVSTTTEPEGRG